jgi:hypothetical protein
MGCLVALALSGMRISLAPPSCRSSVDEPDSRAGLSRVHGDGIAQVPGRLGGPSRGQRELAGLARVPLGPAA